VPNNGEWWQTARRSTPARSLPGGVTRFVSTEASGGIVLLAAAVVALVWANSPWQGSYETLWHTRVAVELGSIRFDEDLRHFVNDGLMALFFLVVGLEIKRELIRGELADMRVAALPVFAALGGMLVPPILYLIIVGGGPGSDGWGIPMATDIAFALGVLALLGTRVPASLKVLLLTLAIVDDIGAIVVIGIFYSDDISFIALLVAVAGLVVTAALLRTRVDWPPLYAALGLATWYATYRSGIHATLAGVAIGLITPANPLAPSDSVRRWAQDLSDEPTAAEVRQVAIIGRESVSPAEHLTERLHSTTSFLILPVFALANAGVEFRSGMLSASGATAVAVGVAVGLIVGKIAGILAGAWLGVRLGLATLPSEVRWVHLAGIGALGGIGFTVSLFVTGLAFPDAQLADAAKVAILGASVVSAVIGATVLAARRS